MGWNIIFRQRPMSIALIKHRTLFGFSPPKPSFPFALANKTQQYAEQRLLGYIFSINIGQSTHFLLFISIVTQLQKCMMSLLT
jgi:hypothetical protein